MAWNQHAQMQVQEVQVRDGKHKMQGQPSSLDAFSTEFAELSGFGGERVTRGQHQIPSTQKPTRHQDLFSELQGHLNHLEDLHGRLHFMMSEVQTLVKKKMS